MARDASTTRAGHGGRGGGRRQRIVRAFDGGTQRVLVRASGDGGTIAEYRTTSASVFDGGTTTAGSASVLRRRHNRGASVFSTAARRRVIGIAMPYYRGTANVELVFCDIMVSLRSHGVFGRRVVDTGQSSTVSAQRGRRASSEGDMSRRYRYRIGALGSPLRMI